MDVIGIGALNIDKLYIVDRIARIGEEVAIKSLKQAPGGSAANTIVALSRLGLKTGFIGRVGRDREGDFLLGDLEREGVDTGGVARVNDPTGLIVGFVDKEGERVLYAYPGANDTLAIDQKNLDYAKKARFLHLSSFVGERSYQAQKKLLKELTGVGISFAPGMLYVRKKLKALELMIRKSSVIFLNREETELLTGEDYTRGVDELLGMGAGMVAVTLGKKGCYIAGEGESHTIGGVPTKAVDTTGAGDAFAAGFLYGLLKGKGLEECGRIGNWVASRCIAEVGARAGLPYERDLIL
jgi:ribokinase